MKTQAILVAADPVYAHWLTESLGGGVEVHLVRDLTSLPEVGHIGLAFVEIDPENPSSGAQTVDHLLARQPELPVFAVGLDSSSEAVLSAVRAGARDYFVLNKDNDNLAGLVGKVLRRASSTTRGQDHARLYTLLSASPSDGLAFLGGHLALALAERSGPSERVLLIDMASPVGASLVYFNVNQTYTLVDALHDVYRCDQTLIDTAFARHESGLFVLSLSEETLGFPELDQQNVVALVETLRAHFGAIVLAADAHTSVPVLGTLVSQSTRTLLLSDQSILRSRQNKTLLQRLRVEECALDRAGLLIENYRARLGLTAENLSELLDLPIYGTLGGQPTQRIHAMNAGEPLFTVAPRDPYARSVVDLADRLDRSGEAGELQPASGDSWVSRLFTS
ncbi:AAA family ATPase [Abyssibacter profundi]|uniref:Pilus assembly protein TadZ N-terminal domain-containing protein n=1 Tax=Abyssibacter profundi TaxID=2182787 RepID=A0A363UQD6_9GAMM|nr:hypothetical protein [Abyssibacter profundi]MBV59982.1 hypothetical protein [Nevskiales bacterium]PWN57646.1 hypothetical protein DEH80_00450 [Abyssibacter profundi]